MKKYNRIFLVLAVMVLAGCEKFVELTPDDNIPVNSFFKTEGDIKNAISGLYGNLRGIYNGYYQYAELPSDNARSFAESEVAQGPFDKLSYTPSTGAVSGAWNDAYRTIANANIILAKITDVPFGTETLKAQNIAEAKFIRALMYFNLVRFFGDVPLVLAEITTEADAYTYTRTPLAEVYAQIEKDLSEAVPALPASYTGPDAGRVTSGAAKALLGKVYLQQKKWINAETILAEVVASGTYQILPDINNVFGFGKDNNAEIIFAVQYIATGFGEGNSYVHTFVPQPSGTTITSVTGNSTCVGTLDLYNAFEPGDIRRDAFLGVYGSGNNTYYWAKKFIYRVTLQNEGENDWPVLRYADVLLMYAEALNNNGKTEEALNHLNTIRTRAQLAPKTGLTQADAQLAIEQERRVELCFEGHRWHDLIRWDKDVSTMQAFKDKYTVIDPGNVNLNPVPERRVMPIPFREVALNPNLTQNPGY